MSSFTGVSVWDLVVCIPTVLLVLILFAPPIYFIVIYFSLVVMTSGIIALAADATEEVDGPLSFPLILLNAFTWPVFWTVTLYRVSWDK
jgi:hypothetical protein